MENKDRYHHGYLKQTMIEEGIKYINQHGIESISLRRLASICNVSHAAPYKHFKDKEDFINQIIIYVVDKFTDTLAGIVDEYSGTTNIMTELGIRYVDFFAKNPNYYYIMFFHNQVDFGTVLSDQAAPINGFPPYQIFKSSAINFMDMIGVEKEEYEDQILFMWSLVQGLASIFTLKGVEYGEQEKLSIRRILGIKKYIDKDD